MELRGERVVLHPRAADHVAALTELGRDPEVRRWWAELDEPYIRKKVEDGLTFAILTDGRSPG